VDRNDRPVVLLNLLFLERHGGDQLDIKPLLDRHCALSGLIGTKEELFLRCVKGEDD
jgi:hypothetical protein